MPSTYSACQRYLQMQHCGTGPPWTFACYNPRLCQTSTTSSNNSATNVAASTAPLQTSNPWPTVRPHGERGDVAPLALDGAPCHWQHVEGLLPRKEHDGRGSELASEA